jgi:hypothetical protein
VGGFRGSDDNLHNAIAIFQHIGIPEPEHAIAARVQVRCALHIILNRRTLRMLRTIQFDHDLRAMARKIRKVWTDWSLSPEMQSKRLQQAKRIPKQLLGRCRAFP